MGRDITVRVRVQMAANMVILNHNQTFNGELELLSSRHALEARNTLHYRTSREQLGYLIGEDKWP